MDIVFHRDLVHKVVNYERRSSEKLFCMMAARMKFLAVVRFSRTPFGTSGKLALLQHAARRYREVASPHDIIFDTFGSLFASDRNMQHASREEVFQVIMGELEKPNLKADGEETVSCTEYSFHTHWYPAACSVNICWRASVYAACRHVVMSSSFSP